MFHNQITAALKYIAADLCSRSFLQEIHTDDIWRAVCQGDTGHSCVCNYAHTCGICSRSRGRLAVK